MGFFDRNKIEQFLQWEGGQRLFNFAYSVGAAIVILGALFKILHLPGGNTMLMIGMGTEVVMFMITAFDRPPKEYKWENVYPQLIEDHDSESVSITAAPTDEEEAAEDDASAAQAPGVAGGPTVIIAGGAASTGMVSGAPQASAGGAPLAGGVVLETARAEGDLLSPAQAESLSQSIDRLATATAQMEQLAGLGEATHSYMASIVEMSEELRRLADSTRALNAVHAVVLDSYRAITDNSAQINGASTGYVEQMQALNHNVAGLNHIYEIQLRSVSGQLDAIDRVNRGITEIRDMFEKSASATGVYHEETEKMARHMRELNRVYENMLHAMTVNMYNPAMGAMASTAAPAQPQGPAASAQ